MRLQLVFARRYAALLQTGRHENLGLGRVRALVFLFELEAVRNRALHSFVMDLGLLGLRVQVRHDFEAFDLRRAVGRHQRI